MRFSGKAYLLTVVLMVGFLLVSTLMVIAADKPDKLVIWPSVEETSVALANELAAQFEAEYGIPVVVQPLHIDLQANQLLLDGPAGFGADLITFSQEDLGTMILQGLLSPYEGDLALDDATRDAFIPLAVEAMMYDGKLWGLPMSVDTYTLVYNKDLVPEPPKTFDELKKIAAEFTDTSNKKYGFLFDVNSFYYTHAFIRGFGGYVFGRDADGGYIIDDIGLNNAGAQEAVAFIKSFFDEGLMPTDVNYVMMDSQFIEGNTPMIINGPWAYDSYLKAGVNLGVATLPELPGGKSPITFSGARAWGISAYSKHKEWAKILAEFMTSKEALTLSYEVTGFIPPHKELTDLVNQNPFAAGVLAQFQASDLMPSCPEMAPVWGAMYQAVITSIRGEAEIKDALDLAVEMVQESIAEMQ